MGSGHMKGLCASDPCLAFRQIWFPSLCPSSSQSFALSLSFSSCEMEITEQLWD